MQLVQQEHWSDVRESLKSLDSLLATIGGVSQPAESPSPPQAPFQAASPAQAPGFTGHGDPVGVPHVAGTEHGLQLGSRVAGLPAAGGASEGGMLSARSGECSAGWARVQNLTSPVGASSQQCTSPVGNFFTTATGEHSPAQSDSEMDFSPRSQGSPWTLEGGSQMEGGQTPANPRRRASSRRGPAPVRDHSSRGRASAQQRHRQQEQPAQSDALDVRSPSAAKLGRLQASAAGGARSSHVVARPASGDEPLHSETEPRLAAPSRAEHQHHAEISSAVLEVAGATPDVTSTAASFEWRSSRTLSFAQEPKSPEEVQLQRPALDLHQPLDHPRSEALELTEKVSPHASPRHSSGELAPPPLSPARPLAAPPPAMSPPHCALSSPPATSLGATDAERLEEDEAPSEASLVDGPVEPVLQIERVELDAHHGSDSLAAATQSAQPPPLDVEVASLPVAEPNHVQGQMASSGTVSESSSVDEEAVEAAGAECAQGLEVAAVRATSSSSHKDEEAATAHEVQPTPSASSSSTDEDGEDDEPPLPQSPREPGRTAPLQSSAAPVPKQVLLSSPVPAPAQDDSGSPESSTDEEEEGGGFGAGAGAGTAVGVASSRGRMDLPRGGLAQQPPPAPAAVESAGNGTGQVRSSVASMNPDDVEDLLANLESSDSENADWV